MTGKYYVGIPYINKSYFYDVNMIILDLTHSYLSNKVYIQSTYLDLFRLLLLLIKRTQTLFGSHLN